MIEKTIYSDAELEVFSAIIMEKLELAQRDYDLLKKEQALCPRKKPHVWLNAS